MTAEEREKLHDLHRAATEAHARAGCGLISWPTAHAADNAFIEALYAIEVTP